MDCNNEKYEWLRDDINQVWCKIADLQEAVTELKQLILSLNRVKVVSASGQASPSLCRTAASPAQTPSPGRSSVAHASKQVKSADCI